MATITTSVVLFNLKVFAELHQVEFLDDMLLSKLNSKECSSLVILEERQQIFDKLIWTKLNWADFYNWNRVKLRYCDGASFAGNAKFDNGVYT